MEDGKTLAHDRRAELLAACPLFRGIDAKGLTALAGRAAQVDVRRREHVVGRRATHQPTPARCRFRVRVVRDGTVVATLGDGEFFGELSVLDRQPRNAMVAAEVRTSCLALASWDFDAVMLEQPALTLAILRGVAMRLREVTESARN